jgi:monovalent cation/proton antiporter MnhG/PhaG subunit
MTATVGWLVCGLALLILLIAALGVYRLPDALSRQHAATKAATLSLTLFALGTALLAWDWAWTWRLLVLVTILFATRWRRTLSDGRRPCQRARRRDDR